MSDLKPGEMRLLWKLIVETGPGVPVVEEKWGDSLVLCKIPSDPAAAAPGLVDGARMLGEQVTAVILVALGLDRFNQQGELQGMRVAVKIEDAIMRE